MRLDLTRLEIMPEARARATSARSPISRSLISGCLAALACAAALMGCASEGQGDTRRTLLERWSTELIVPLYAEFDERTRDVVAAVDALCAAPSEATLAAARTAWDAAREPFKRAEVFAFGPYSRPEFRIGPKIDSWPARPAEVEEWLAGSEPVDAATLAQLGVWHKGLPVLEYFLFSREASAQTQLVDPRRCEYLRSTAAELENRAREIHLAWAPEGGDFAQQLSGAGRTSTAWRSLRDAFGEVVNRMGFTIENVRRDKLGRPLGDMTGGVTLPNETESRFSGRAIRDILDNLAGIELLFFGDAARGLPGVSSYAVERGRNFDDSFRTSLDAARIALTAVNVPLGEAVSTEADRVRDASARLNELQTLIQTELISALGLSLNFNDNDGD